MFLIALSTLALEVTLTRILSVTTWYHLAFFAVSIAMLGMTAGAVTVYLKPAWFEARRLRGSLARACLAYAGVVPLALLALCVIRIDVGLSLKGYYPLVLASLASLAPFYFSGIAVAGALTRSDLAIGKLYAADLAGASLGCILVLGAVGPLGAPNLVLVSAAVAVAAGVCFAGRQADRQVRGWAVGLLCALAALVALGVATPYGIRPMVAKGKPVDPGKHLLEVWNSYSMVAMFSKDTARPQFWGPSPLAPRDEKISQYRMSIDGGAGTSMRKFGTMADIDHLRYDVTNVAYFLRPQGGALVVGMGGGRDVQSAILFGHERVVGVDINPIFIDLLENRFRDFAGIADHPGVTLVADEARSYLSRSRDTYSVIQMSLIDTWAATGAGAFALSENALYTVEAWKIFLAHLAGDGVFTVSRWYNPKEIGETGRIVSLAVASLLASGVDDPARHIAMVTRRTVATLVVGKQPLGEADVRTLREVCDSLSYTLAISPDEPTGSPRLAAMLASRTASDLDRAIAGAPMNYSPPTDESPYFFNMLRLNQVLPAFVGRDPEGRVHPDQAIGVSYGNLIATRTLLGLLAILAVLAAATVLLPLALGLRRGGGRGVLWPAAGYFALIGAGFMLVEIALVQRLTVFLGHPMYALGILLFTIIASAGVGSFLSERLPLDRRPWVFVYPVVIAAAILGARFLLPALGTGMAAASMAAKVPVAVLALFPLGLLMGAGFPTGMRLVRQARAGETPWYWAINGVCGVLCAALTVFVSIYFGISTSLYLGSGCYLLLLVCLPGVLRAAEPA
jgi:hypothetical protein